MRRVWVLVPLLASCDDTVFSGGGGGGGETYDPSWEGVQALMVDKCESCHSGENPSGGVLLPEDVATDIADGTGIYVVPGDPDNSMLWQVISMDPPPAPLLGMPFGSTLPPESVAHVKWWIYYGAPLEEATP